MADKYCVYAHTDLEGTPFYIGSGTERRAYRKELQNSKSNSSFRGHKYSAKVKELSYNYNVVLLEQNLTLESARDMEMVYYDKFKEYITNNRRPVKVIQIAKEFVENYVYYDPSSKTGLRWKVERRCGRGRLSHNIGDEAGSKSTSGWRVCIENVEYYVSRIIMVLHNNILYDSVVDHIDGDKFNNNLDNLRVVSYAENSRNRKKPTNNTSGITGVVLHKNESGATYFVAQWREGDKVKRKSFNTEKYGFENAKILAEEYRKEQILRLNNEGYGYSDTHGFSRSNT